MSQRGLFCSPFRCYLIRCPKGLIFEHGRLNATSLAEILLAAEAVAFVALSVGFAAPAAAAVAAVFAAAAAIATVATVAAQHLHIHYAGLQESLQQPL